MNLKGLQVYASGEDEAGEMILVNIDLIEKIIPVPGREPGGRLFFYVSFCGGSRTLITGVGGFLAILEASLSDMEKSSGVLMGWGWVTDTKALLKTLCDLSEEELEELPAS